MPFVDPADMLAGEPLPGWSGRFCHSGNMTFALYEITEDAEPLHGHHHEQEEVWHIVEGQVAITIDGAEATLEAGSVAIVPPNTPHSVRPLRACKAIIADYPLRLSLPGMQQIDEG